MHLSLFFYQLGAPVKAEYWLYESTIVKHNLIAAIKEPKLVVLGGSSTLFGIDSALLEHTLGIPTINLALHAGFSFEHLVQEAQQYLQPHDHVLLSIEYYRYTRVNPYSLWFTNQMMTWDTAFFWRLPTPEKIRFILSVPMHRLVAGAIAQVSRERVGIFDQRRLSSPKEVIHRHAQHVLTFSGTEIIYSALNLDRHGDAVTSGKSLVVDTDYGLTKPFVYSERVWDEFRRFAKFCRNRDISLYIAWPPSMKNIKLDLASETVSAHLQNLRTQLQAHQLQTLGLPQEYQYDRELFSDTADHLTAIGRSTRTQALLHYLKQYPFPSLTSQQ
ncbi:MAG: hypothetical protein SGJ26_00550 [Nitrospirota bacterium]|nr:hypothetical protein [Nitrospirota bacterium]